MTISAPLALLFFLGLTFVGGLWWLMLVLQWLLNGKDDWNYCASTDALVKSMEGGA